MRFIYLAGALLELSLSMTGMYWICKDESVLEGGTFAKF